MQRIVITKTPRKAYELASLLDNKIGSGNYQNISKTLVETDLISDQQINMLSDELNIRGFDFEVNGVMELVNKKYHELQKAAQLSNSQAAALLEVNISTIKRWRNGSTEAPKAVLMALEYQIKLNKELLEC